MQIQRQGLGAGVTPCGILVQALQADAFQFEGQTNHEAGRG
jgi:hypothetical protein